MSSGVTASPAIPIVPAPTPPVDGSADVTLPDAGDPAVTNTENPAATGAAPIAEDVFDEALIGSTGADTTATTFSGIGRFGDAPLTANEGSSGFEEDMNVFGETRLLPQPALRAPHAPFVAVGTHLESVEQVTRMTDNIKARLEKCATVEEFADIVDDYCYLMVWVDEEETDIFHQQRLHTQDAGILAKQAALEPMVTAFNKASKEIVPAMARSPFVDQLTENYGTHFAGFVRMAMMTRNDAPLSHVDERKQWRAAKTAYNKAIVTKVTLAGKEVNVRETQTHLDSASRSTCKVAWEALTTAYLGNLAAADAATTDALTALWKIADDSGVEGATPLQFLETETHTSADEIRSMIAAVGAAFAPLYRQVLEDKRAALELAPQDFKPWDVGRTPRGLSPLRPYASPKKHRAKTIAVAKALNDDFGTLVEKMFADGLLDVTRRPDKYARPYIVHMLVSGRTGISVIPTGTQNSLQVDTEHELGHAWHTDVAAKSQANTLNGVMGLYSTQGKDKSLMELVSVTLQNLSGLVPEAMYDNPADQERAKKQAEAYLLNEVLMLCVKADYELWLYTSKDALDPAKRDAYYIDCLKRYGIYYGDSWAEFDTQLASSRFITAQDAVLKPLTAFWFYGVNSIAAIQAMIYAKRERSVRKAVARLIPAMQAGASVGFEETWALAGLSTDFSAEKMQEYADELASH